MAENIQNNKMQEKSEQLDSCIKKIKYPVRLRLKKSPQKTHDQIGVPMTVKKKLHEQNQILYNNIENLCKIQAVDQHQNFRKQSLYQLIMDYRQRNAYLQALVLSLGTQLKQKYQDADSCIINYQGFERIEPAQRLKEYIKKYQQLLITSQNSNSLTKNIQILKQVENCKNRINEVNVVKIYKQYYTNIEHIFHNLFNTIQQTNNSALQMQNYIIQIKRQLNLSYQEGSLLQYQLEKAMLSQTKMHELNHQVIQLKNTCRLLQQQLSQYRNKYSQIRQNQSKIEFNSQHNNDDDSRLINQQIDTIMDSYRHIKSMHEIRHSRQIGQFHQNQHSRQSCQQQMTDHYQYQKQVQRSERDKGSLLEIIDQTQKSERSCIDLQMQYLQKIYSAAKKSTDEYQKLLNKYHIVNKHLKSTQIKLKNIQQAINQNLGKIQVDEQQADIKRQIQKLLINFEERIQKIYDQRLQDFNITVTEQLLSILKQQKYTSTPNLQNLTIYDLLQQTKQLIKQLKNQQDEFRHRQSSQQNNQQASYTQLIDSNKLMISSTQADRMRDTIQKIEGLLLENEQILSSDFENVIANLQQFFKYLQDHQNNQGNQINIGNLKQYLTKLENNILKLRDSTYFDHYQKQQQANSSLLQQIKRYQIENNIFKYRINSLLKYLTYYEEEFQKQKHTYGRDRLEIIMNQILDYLIKQISIVLGSEDQYICIKANISDSSNRQIVGPQFGEPQNRYEETGSILKSQRDYKPQFTQLLKFLTQQFEELRKYNYPNAYEIIEKIEIDLIKISQAENSPDIILHYCKKIFKVLQENEQKNRLQFERRQKIIKFRSNMVNQICKKGEMGQYE